MGCVSSSSGSVYHCSLESKHRDKTLCSTAEHLPKWLQHIHLHHRRLFVENSHVLRLIIFESEWAHVSWLCQSKTRCGWLVFGLQQDLVKMVELLEVSVVCLSLHDGRFVVAESMRCWIFFSWYVVMETNIWLKAFATVTMMSHSLALCGVKRMHGIFTVSCYDLVRHIFKVHHRMRLLLSNRNLKVRVKQNSLSYIGLSGLLQCPIFCLGSNTSSKSVEHFLYSTQLPSKPWRNEKCGYLRRTRAYSQ